MNERCQLCRDLARTIAADTSTATAASHAAIDQTWSLIGMPMPEGFIDAFKERHTQIMLTLTAEIEELHAQKFEASELTETDLRWLLVVQQSPILKRFAQVMTGLLSSDELQQLLQKVGRDMMNFCEQYERDLVLVS